jgi:hypothetical protein
VILKGGGRTGTGGTKFIMCITSFLVDNGVLIVESEFGMMTRITPR